MKKIMAGFILWVTVSGSFIVFAQSGTGVTWDTVMKIPSPINSNSWFPDLALDSKGNVHVVWNETGKIMGSADRGPEGVYYSMWNGKQWAQYVDIISPQKDIVRNSISIDDQDQLNLLFDYSPPFGLYYKSVASEDAFNINLWSEPQLVNENNNTYYSDIVSYKDYLHIVYDDGAFYAQQCEGCADVYYRNSPDDGKTWSDPISLFSTPTGSGRAQIKVDSSGVIYVTWDEGWDRITDIGDPEYGVFVTSADNGATWSAPLKISQPNATNSQFTVGTDGKGGVMLAWRTVSPEYPGIYYQWSDDYGKTWTDALTVPNVISKISDSRFDVYDMATDSNGHIHLIVTGYLSSSGRIATVIEEAPGLFHFEWDGSAWSAPTTIYKGGWYPEYPRIVIGQGNQLNLVWFLREDPIEIDSFYEVWYAHGVSNSPFIQNTTMNGEPPNQAADTQSSDIKVTQIQTSVPVFDDSKGMGLVNPFSEVDDYLVMLISIIPVAVLIIVVVTRSRSKQ